MQRKLDAWSPREPTAKNDPDNMTTTKTSKVNLECGARHESAHIVIAAEEGLRLKATEDASVGKAARDEELQSEYPRLKLQAIAEWSNEHLKRVHLRQIDVAVALLPEESVLPESAKTPFSSSPRKNCPSKGPAR
jgi:hypothetical protein